MNPAGDGVVGRHMAAMGRLARMEMTWPDLTTRQRAIARVLIDHPGLVTAAPARDLSKRSGVSEATVSRFVRKLGYSSFVELRIALSTTSPRQAGDPSRRRYQP